MDISNYKVELSDFSERHYIKDFAKEHKSKWAKTIVDIVDICKRIDKMLALGRQQIDLIKAVDGHKLVKLAFAVEGTHKSPKNSGSRAILWINDIDRVVTILMIYGKGHVRGKGETVWWQKEIRGGCGGVDELFWSASPSFFGGLMSQTLISIKGYARDSALML